MKRHLPPLNALRIFETAARSASLSAAAEELGITHGAVSRQIALLEQWLGQPLFTRQGQRNVATEHARALAAEISSAFDRVSDATIRFGRAPSTRVVQVNVQTTFATRWLIPRLSEFHSLHPDIEIVLNTSNSTDSKRISGFDVLIRRDPPEKPEWQYFEKRHIFDEHLTLLVAPALLLKKPLERLCDLKDHIFISSQTRTGEWDSWLKAASIEPLRPVRFQRFDHYHVALQAIIDGLGVGIGGLPTLEHDVRQGRLVAPFSEQVVGSRYFAMVPPDVDKSTPLLAFLSWIETQASGVTP